jgi:rhodanese-related sulfurtransferase/heme-degrading monooxygenase HmoA
MSKIIVDVRTREEFRMAHIKGAINIPHYDLEFYIDFLKGKEIFFYCNTERRALIAQEKLAKMGMDSKVLGLEEHGKHEWVKNTVVCAANFVSLRPGHEEQFMEKAMNLCRAVEHLHVFLGSKVLKISGASGIGSCVPGDLTNLEVQPARMILLTYWTSKDAHERSHLDPDFKAAFDALQEHLTEMPREEFYEVLK